MILKMYTDSLLNELKTNVKLNMPKYASSTSFVSGIVDNYDMELYNLELDVQYPELDKTMGSKENGKNQWELDFNNAVLLHKEFVNKYQIPLGILSDERFISYLAHDIYYDYMNVRWPYNGKENRIRQKYFLVGSSQAFTRNTFLRYFWYTYITYDAKLEDPYELTRTAFENQDVVNQIMERKYSRNKKIVLAALRAIKNTNTKIPNSKRTLLGKALNNILSLYSLDAFSSGELVELCENEIRNIIGSNIVDTTQEEEE